MQDCERGRNVCLLTSKPFALLLFSAVQYLSDDLASTQKKAINKSCPPLHIPPRWMPVLLSHGCNFLVQTFRLTKYRSLPAGNAKRLHALSQSSKSLTDYARFSRGRVGELRDHFFRFTYTCTLHPSFLSCHKYLHILLRKKKR